MRSINQKNKSGVEKIHLLEPQQQAFQAEIHHQNKKKTSCKMCETSLRFGALGCVFSPPARCRFAHQSSSEPEPPHHAAPGQHVESYRVIRASASCICDMYVCVYYIYIVINVLC